MGDACIAVFPSTHSVIKAEKALLRRGIAVDAAPVPRHISSDCGIGLRFECAFEKAVRDAIAEENIRITGVYNEKQN
jgi:hypothetical protein